MGPDRDDRRARTPETRPPEGCLDARGTDPEPSQFGMGIAERLLRLVAV
jgi:hypothetical protein